MSVRASARTSASFPLIRFCVTSLAYHGLVGMVAARSSSQWVAAASTGRYKDVWILRHGQATHNPRAEAAKDEGCSHETFLELMRQDDSLDSALTAIGQQQARDVWNAHRTSPWPHRIQLVVSSPLSRAMQTADFALPPNTYGNERPHLRVLHESFREINGWLLNAKRRSVSEIQRTFPHWDVEHLHPHEEDSFWTPDLETHRACSERGYQGLGWLLSRPEDRILLVTHGGILRFTMTEHPRVQVRDGRSHNTSDSPSVASAPPSTTAAAATRHVHERFTNCELRRYRIQWQEEDAVENNTGDDEDTDSRRTILMTELDVDQPLDATEMCVAVSEESTSSI